MKRLTRRDEHCNADIIGVNSADLQLHLDFNGLNMVTNALNKLAAYEDSGLEPKEIPKLQTENALLRKVAEAVADLYSDWMEYGYMDSITSRSLITVFETWKTLADLDEADHD